MDIKRLSINGILSETIPLLHFDLMKILLIHVSTSHWEQIHILILYVDGIFLVTNELSLLHDTRKFRSKIFEMKDIGDATYMIGIEIFRDRSQRLLRLS